MPVGPRHQQTRHLVRDVKRVLTEGSELGDHGPAGEVPHENNAVAIKREEHVPLVVEHQVQHPRVMPLQVPSQNRLPELHGDWPP
eukprot:2820584-Rhodomonas_salina.2